MVFSPPPAARNHDSNTLLAFTPWSKNPRNNFKSFKKITNYSENGVGTNARCPQP
jgi:hypothetical protein